MMVFTMVMLPVVTMDATSVPVGHRHRPGFKASRDNVRLVAVVATAPVVHRPGIVPEAGIFVLADRTPLRGVERGQRLGTIADRIKLTAV